MFWQGRGLNRQIYRLAIWTFIENLKPLALMSMLDRLIINAGWHWLLRGNIGVDIPVDSQEGIRDNLLRRPDTAPAVSG